ncbi:MAG: DegV family protein [Lachnospiraceae bacterium]|nr:DegV family protein [Lachnospiraceae bacterium]
MKKVAIVTDTSGITMEAAEKLGVFVIPMPFTIDGVEYLEGVNLSKEEFYEKLNSDADISTSQPAAGEVMDLWDKLLEEYDEIIHIPISSGLSGSCANAFTYAQDYDGKVQVVDAQRVSVPQRASVEDAVNLVKEGKTAQEIKEILENEQQNSSIYVMVETLKHLKKGGRITPAAAAIGTVLRIKPILQIHGKQLDAYAKVRSMAKGKQTIFKALEQEMERMGVSAPEDVRLQAACSYGYEGKEQWVRDLEEHFPGFQVEYDDLPLNLTCHIGPGGMGAAVTKRLKF